MIDDEVAAAREKPTTPISRRVGGALLLTFQSGTLSGQTFEYSEARTIVIGRSRDCDIPVFDDRVSRRHCSIRFEDGLVHVKDLGSANGTLLNGRPVKLDRAHGGDVLRLGDATQIRIVLGPSEGTVRLARVAFKAPVETGRVLRDPSLGVAIPGFRIDGLLGEGATSAVFKARREREGDLVAVKVMKLAADARADDRQRFLREAETSAKLVHPNVVRTFGQGEVGELLYIVMEYVRGETVGAQLRRLGQLPVPVALHVTGQIAAALEHARTRGVVHRDVKPDNMLIQEDGTVKLGDFGLAKCRMAMGVSALTQQGDVLGTLAYMAPEQLESAMSAGHASDIYSLGASLFHMVAGRTPFSARTHVEYFQKILEVAPPVLAIVRPGVLPVVSALVSRCLAKHPEDRFESAREIERLVGQLLASGEKRSTVS